MKRILGGLIVMILTAVIANAQGGKVEQEILKLEQEWQDALLKSDVAALERIYSDGITYTHSSAATDTKASYIAKIKSGASKYQTLKRDDIKVSIFGDTAVVTCHWMVTSVGDGKSYNTNARYIHVYAKVKGKWQMVAHQSTPISS
ncbi:MAG: nuclear transport factor 2 family protein [Acidobacteria bacterium]|nr:nuclear transport factor 2 family protein [Acidobacteriota bacterium]